MSEGASYVWDQEYGQDNNKYLMLKVEPNKIKTAIATSSWQNEKQAIKSAVYPNNSRVWQNIKEVKNFTKQDETALKEMMGAVELVADSVTIPNADQSKEILLFRKRKMALQSSGLHLTRM